MKDDELWFFKQVCERCSNHGISDEENETRKKWVDSMLFGQMLIHISPRDIINEPNFPINYKRAWYLLEKWGDKNWYDWGVTLDLGWITEHGNEEYKKLLTK